MHNKAGTVAIEVGASIIEPGPNLLECLAHLRFR